LKNLLIIAYYFPPSGGPGVQRVLKHIKYLPEFGWNPIVLTVENGEYQAIDTSLIKEIPESTIVRKSRIFEPYDIYRKFTGRKKGEALDVNNIKKDNQKSPFVDRVAELIRATIFIPDARIGWFFSAKKEAKKILEEYEIDAIYSSSPPYTCSVIANSLQKETKLPWVAGFRDPWTGFLTTPNRWFLPAKIDRTLEHSVFKNATAVEAAWQGIIKDALGKYDDLDESKFHHVPNGYDSSDFPVAEYVRNEKFTLTYTGSLYGRRNPKSLFDAIEKLIKMGKIDKEKLKLVFVGRFGEEVEDMFRNASFNECIETIGYVTHKESIEYLIKSEALLLIVDEAKESEEIVPGKVYEYLGTMRPLFAIAPNKSAIAELIYETDAGLVAHQSEIDKIAENLVEFYNDWERSYPLTEPNVAAIEQYERRNASKKLAEILDGVC
jgi:hypothetical protein